MFDFIKNNKKIFGLIFLGLFIVILLFGIMLFISSKTVDPEESATFPDTSEGRDIGDTQTDLFGPADADRWVPDETGQLPAPLFRAITEIPVSSAVAFEKAQNTTLTPFVRYIALNNGHVFETPLDVVAPEDKLSIENIHRIGDTLWSKNGNTFITRYYGDDKNTVIHSRLGIFIQGSSTDLVDNAINSYFELDDAQLDEQVISATFSPDGTRIFYLTKTAEGVSGYIRSIKSGGQKLVWESVFRNLTVSWENPNTIIIYKNPSSVSEGIVWALDAHSLEYSPILGKEYALAAKMSPDGEHILYSLQEKKNAVFSLRVLDMETGNVTILPIEGMVDKCTWGSAQYIYCAVSKNSRSGDFLEKWYMGIEHTNDVLWRIDVRNGNIKKLLDPEEETGEPFDIVNLDVSPKEDYIVFISRVNRALWALELPQQIIETEVEIE